jgi:hypothetical protein
MTVATYHIDALRDAIKSARAAGADYITVGANENGAALLARGALRDCRFPAARARQLPRHDRTILANLPIMLLDIWARQDVPYVTIGVHIADGLLRRLTIAGARQLPG